jgi:hypothetical protein
MEWRRGVAGRVPIGLEGAVAGRSGHRPSSPVTGCHVASVGRGEAGTRAQAWRGVGWASFGC